MKNFKIFIGLLALVAAMSSQLFAADNLFSDGTSGNWQLLDNAGTRWNTQLLYTTNGSGDVITMGGLSASGDNVIGDLLSGNHQLIDNSGKRWNLRVTYTTDGAGNVIPVSGGGGGGGITSLNGLSGASQTFSTGTTGTDFGIVSSGTVHTFNLPTASASNRGLLSSANFTSFSNRLFNTDGLYSLANTSDATKLMLMDLSGQTTSTTITISPQNTSNMVLHVPQVATSSGAGMALVQDETTGFIFSNGITSSIGAANSMMQLANASTANRAQIKLHSYFNGASVAGVSTLTSRSGTIAVNSAVVAGQDYSKWTAQAAATTPGSAPISGAWAFKANTVNSLTVASDFHLQLTNLAGTLADRLYLSSEGLLQLPGYASAGYAKFDASGNVSSGAILGGDIPQAADRRYIDYVSGNDSTGTGSATAPWKTIQHACNSITPTINVPIVLNLTGGNNDTDTGTITCSPNVALNSDYSIQVAVPFTVTGGSTNDQFWASNIEFIGAFTWSRSDATDMSATFSQVAFGGAVTLKQAGAGGLALYMYNSSIDAAAEIQAPLFGSLFYDTQFNAATTFDDVTSASYYEFTGGYMGAPISISGGPTAYFSGVQADVPFGYTLTSVTTGNGTPSFQGDSSSIPPVIVGTPTLIPTTYTPQGASGQQPACTASTRGLQWLTDGTTGVADIFQICQKTVADTYLWTTH